MSNIIRMPTSACPPPPCPPPCPPPSPAPPGMQWWWDGCQWVCVACPPPSPPPPGPPFPGAQWQWDGTQWVCAPLPPCPLPLPCPPPQPVPPSCFSAIAKAQACFDQSQALTQLITDVVTQIFKDHPEIIPPPPPSAGSGPILGVTDGSAAKAGEVGELFFNTVSFPYTATAQTQSVNMGVLQPGDWDCEAEFIPGGEVQGAYFALSPQPVGVNGTMSAQLGTTLTTAAGAANFAVLNTMSTRASITVPTLFAFSVTTNWIGSAGSAATGIMIFRARRMR